MRTYLVIVALALVPTIVGVLYAIRVVEHVSAVLSAALGG